MAEIILFHLTGKILSTLTPHVINHISLTWFVKKQLMKLREKITMVRSVLLDAQDQQNSKLAVKEWLRKLKGVLYEADDLFDEVATECLKRDVIINKNQLRKVRYFFTSSNPVLFHYSLGGKIKDIMERLDEICADMRDFGFLVRTLDKPIIKRKEGSTSFVDARNILGRDDDKKNLLQILLSTSNEETVHVIPILGMGGLGKTTLAQMIFNDKAIKKQFDIKFWVCVSDDFNVKRIIAEILTAIGENVINDGMEQLQIHFQEHLSGAKFFLVLDDVWNDDPVEWKKLEELIMIGARGSRVLVTTRDKKVADIVCTMEPYVLKGLSEKECLTILVKWAFKKGEEDNHPDLLEIGREIVKKCGGVPLAARTLGVLLYSKTSQHEWLLVRNSEMWAQVQSENDVIPILKLSYDQMPSSLKECFGYCSIFQKDKVIYKQELMYQWIAHGLVQSSDRNVELEDVCETYFNELLRRSFLEYTPDTPDTPSLYASFSKRIAVDEVDLMQIANFKRMDNFMHRADIQISNHLCFKMHDLVHDLAQYVVGGENMIVKRENVLAGSDRVRHVSIHNFSEIPKCLLEKNNFLFTVMRRGYNYLAFRDNFDIVTGNCRHLRVLDYRTDQYFLPKIGRMRHLRYLRCHGLMIIPKSLSKLLNLQFLDLTSSSFNEFPEDFGNLRNLRVLIFSSSELVCLPEEIRNLASLRKLVIGYSPRLQSLGTGLRYTTSLKHLEVSQCSQLEFSDYDFQGLASLKYLGLKGLPRLELLPMGLQNSGDTLKHLAINDCCSVILTEEVLPNLHSLEVLEIQGCDKIMCLPKGIQNLVKLTHLNISSIASVTLEDRCIPTGDDWSKIAHVPHILVHGLDARSL